MTKPAPKPYVVMVPQLGGGDPRPFFFDVEPLAKAFARDAPRGSALYVKYEDEAPLPPLPDPA